MSEYIGILHPGEMGVSVAASARNSGHAVYWSSEGRSPETRRRAEEQKLIEAATLAELCRSCSILISVCPPHAAEEVAGQVLAQSFAGLYLDANAISPQRAIRIGKSMEEAGIAFVDGGIIGGPAWKPGVTWLFLSGTQAQRAADCFAAGPLQTEIISEEIGQASALKMCYAAYSKGTTALLAAVLGAAESLGVRADLERQWSRDDAEFPAQTQKRVRRVTAKAWRFTGEMDEIAETFDRAGLPDGFHQAASEIYARIAGLRGSATTPEIEQVLAALIKNADFHPPGTP